MDLHNTLEKHVMQLKIKPRTLRNVALVEKEITATLYENYFPGAENLDQDQKAVAQIVILFA